MCSLEHNDVGETAKHAIRALVASRDQRMHVESLDDYDDVSSDSAGDEMCAVASLGDVPPAWTEDPATQQHHAAFVERISSAMNKPQPVKDAEQSQPK